MYICNTEKEIKKTNINTKNIINMERINIEDARIRVEFRKNETNEVIKSEWFDVVSYFCSLDFEHEMEDILKETRADYYKIVEFEDIPKELQLSDRLPDETIELCNYFNLQERDEYFKEAFFYWLDNYHYKLLGSDILYLINRAKDAYMGYYEDIQTFVEEMFNAQYPDCPPDIKYYIDYSLFQRDLMYDFWEIDGHIFKQ